MLKRKIMVVKKKLTGKKNTDNSLEHSDDYDNENYYENFCDEHRTNELEKPQQISINKKFLKCQDDKYHVNDHKITKNYKSQLEKQNKNAEPRPNLLPKDNVYFIKIYVDNLTRNI